jgi:hypothetical protein
MHMAGVTSASEDGRLRPEDATTLEEFQARRDAELDRIGAAYRSGRGRVRLALVIAGMVPCGFLWYWFWQSSGAPKFGILALALAYNYLLVRVANRFDGTRRRRELQRLSKRWQARAEAGQVPRATP